MTFDPSLDRAPELLALAARRAGSRHDLSQGGGGNVSIKIGAERMLVKASGSRLKDLTPRAGWALVNYGNIKRRIAAGAGSDAEFSEYIRAQALPAAGVPPADPSIETGFHSLLNTVVIHTHSVYANVLNMSEEGHALGRRLFPGAEFIPYRAPGPRLCTAINERARPSSPQIFFLGNHGLLASHAGVEGALELNERVNETIRRGLKLPPYPEVRPCEGLSPHNAERVARYGRAFLLGSVLSPDQALYCGAAELDGKASPAVNEVLTALFYILDCIAALKLTPRFLRAEDVASLSAVTGGRYSRPR